MARTIYAGALPVGLGLQGASDTVATAMGIENENQRAKDQSKIAQAQIARLEALSEADELDRQIREEERERMRQEASVEQMLLRASLDPEAASREREGMGLDPYAAQFAGATPEQSKRLGSVMALGQRVREQRDAAADLGEKLQMAQMLAMSDGEASPGYAEGLADLSARLAGYDPMNPDAETPQEIATAWRALREQDVQFRAQRDHTQRAVADYDASFGQGPEYAFGRALVSAGEFDQALEFGMKTKYPRVYSKVQEDAAEKAVSKIRESFTDELMRMASLQGITPGTPEFVDLQKNMAATYREVHGEEAFPKTQVELQEEQRVQQEDAWGRMLKAAGVPLEEALEAIQQGPEAVNALLQKKAKEAEGKRWKVPKGADRAMDQWLPGGAAGGRQVVP